nr:uncharacterized protein LOC120966829 [Aegilops tauschii subsp. strangulata]XP_045086245.1 uncharacterized protein LOC123494445 [Aegilops tauschii subsp. strangulata]
MWDIMKRLRGESSLPWMCIGDFNEILRPDEQHGLNARDSAQIEAFGEAVDVCGLAGLGYRALDWTWEKKVAGGHFADIEHLTAAKSDHCPILLDTELADTSVCAKQKQFRYECMWGRDSSFGDILADAWTSAGPAQTVSALSSKLATVTGRLQRWGRTTFGAVRSELRSLRQQLHLMRSLPNRTGSSAEENSIEARMLELCLREEIMWHQRARIQWLAEGDSNTKFFHQKASARKAKNRIVELQRGDGSVCKEEHEMADMATNFYSNLYASENTVGIEEVLSHIPTRVDATMNTTLNAQYSKAEIKTALFQMFPTKAPGPDGFAIASKVLANRLKLILPDIISEEQSTFLPGRLITDNFISAYECLHYMKRKKLKGNRFCALKLDMMKAYDRLEWNYLERVMLKLGISPRFTEIVMRCVTSVSFSVIFNGGKQEEFRPSRGLRQGDPISPYLFLLAAEGLSCLLKSTRSNERIQGIMVAAGAPQGEKLSDKYLGLPADVGRVKEGSFKYLKDRIRKQVQGWMEKALSVGGKEVLIKSVAQAIPTYSMACFKLPRGLCQHINGLLRKFWWGSKNGERKTAWVSWEVMSQPKFMGGMGFRGIELFNLALLARQAWRLLQEPNSLSARILKVVYYPTSSILEAEVGKNPSQVWHSIVEGRDTLKLGLVKRIGSGKDTHIWLDNWIPRDFKLQPVCPKSPNPPQKVSEIINPTTLTWDGAALEEHFYAMEKEAILNIPLSSRVREDFWSWHYERKGIFTVRSAYRLLSSTKQQ